MVPFAVQASRGCSTPCLLALAPEAARRAGLCVGIVAGADGAFVAHRELAERVGHSGFGAARR